MTETIPFSPVDDSITQSTECRDPAPTHGLRGQTAAERDNWLSMPVRERRPDLVRDRFADCRKWTVCKPRRGAAFKNSPVCPIILTTAKGSEEIAAHALRTRGIGYVPKRRSRKNSFRPIERMMSMVDVAGARDRSLVVTHFRSTSNSCSATHDDEVPNVIARLETTLTELGCRRTRCRCKFRQLSILKHSSRDFIHGQISNLHGDAYRGDR